MALLRRQRRPPADAPSRESDPAPFQPAPPWGPRPEESRVVAAFLGALGGGVHAEAKPRLDALLTRLPHLDAPQSDVTRSWLCADWLVREHLPAWLELAGLGRRARALRRLAPLRDAQSQSDAVEPLVAARQAAAEGAGRDAAWEATWADRWEAAGAATRDAAWEAAAGSAWRAARDGAGFVDWADARAAAGDAAWDAARAASWDAAWEAADEDPREGAVLALAPTAAELDFSALDLLARMLDPSAKPGDH